MTENNAAQPVLTDDEVRAIITDAHQSHGAFKTGYGLSLGRAIEQAVLSKLRAEGVQAGDERAALAWYAEQVAGCRKFGADGDAARQALDKDGGRRARAALASTPVAAIPPEKPLPDLMMATYHEAVGWNACRAAMLRSMPLASAPVADDWTPTPANINALPERVRAYIHDLVANADPSGMVAENTLLRDQTKQLDAMIGRLKRELASAPVAGEVQERIEQMAVNRYRPVPDGKFSYKVVAGDGSRSLYTGTKDSCLRVAAKLTEAFLDGAFVASDAAPQASEAVRPCTCQPDWGAKK
ncbi:hypothetical protein KMC56_gp25 [Achromobacter phage vB_AxyP_19-32_Axy12]|uniref:Uncharacterized protein n=1 Tax=Achromobacter phage vB_AxyP_19-32_Axy12 TaxID=2591043 RepID=A0A514CUF0_9CAUD|nr:hypothetical protein KMC56_gp25 [Achromobacter phage vB_AxyP_19-32_Axy12]QDH84098.1 hypothetical protein Axy12_025 [Achromobacter phage vB_AxyP_19-32_Axy12]